MEARFRIKTKIQRHWLWPVRSTSWNRRSSMEELRLRPSGLSLRTVPNTADWIELIS